MSTPSEPSASRSGAMWTVSRGDPGRRSARAVLLYAVAWFAAAAAVVGLVYALFDGQGDRETVSVPPVREPALVDAVDQSGCRYRVAAAGV